MPQNDDRSLLKTLGGEAGCRHLAQSFYARVATNEQLKSLFPGKSLRCATEEFSAFLIQFLDGDPDQTQYRWWLSLRESHARFQISDRQRDAWLSLMEETTRSMVTDPPTRDAWDQFFRVASAYIVGREEGEAEHPELNRRWSRQRALDQLVDDISNGRDAEAITLSQQFAARPAVLVGILAKMMVAGREPLIDFVLESLRKDARVAKSRFNGRTLLHFAAGAPCLPVVRQLLLAGVDPDVVDGGGHTPLYRAGGSGETDQGAAIVKELVRAGASVDHAGGITKSTALHEAARHGNRLVAAALLEEGANPLARDKRGLTPLDRARNFRRLNVVALLDPR